ncbi:MAG TPA: hypothetical protein VKR31_15070, partial [Rhizomicrobium sp.]|nr:hypothetical protein [Rhizomicrobium sp.]
GEEADASCGGGNHGNSRPGEQLRHEDPGPLRTRIVLWRQERLPFGYPSRRRISALPAFAAVR